MYRDRSTSMTSVFILLSKPTFFNHPFFPHGLFYFLFVLDNINRIDNVVGNPGDSFLLMITLAQSNK